MSRPPLPPSRPFFVDNRAGNTLDRALARHFGSLRSTLGLPWGVDIATAFFNLGGFQGLADELEQVGRVRLLLGAEPLPEARRHARPTKEFMTQRDGVPEFNDDDTALAGGEDAEAVQAGLEVLARSLARHRDLLPFSTATLATVRRLLAFLSRSGVEVRRYTRQFLHAKAYIFRTQGGGALVGSSNLTSAGLRHNLELNLGHFEDPVVGKVEQWFDELWSDATPFDLAAVYASMLVDFPPYLVFLRILWELYHGELAEEKAETGETLHLTGFQQHGVWRAQRIIDRYGGALVADGVGLGKTFLAGEIMRRYRQDKLKVLLVCPAALRDSTWQRFLPEHLEQFRVPVVSYEQLANDPRLGGEGSRVEVELDELALLVVDEAHNYRSPDSPKRARVLAELMRVRKPHVLLLTATPVNNALWDLFHLLRCFIRQDAAFADRGVLSMKGRFEDAERIDPFNLSPDVLFPIIDATTVKRTRRFIRRHYANDQIRLPGGQMATIRFPTPVASTITYDLETISPGLLARIEQVLMPATGHPDLTLARYQPQNYPAGGAIVGTDHAIVGLLRSGLLKRFESSIRAFALTCGRMVRQHELFLKALDKGQVAQKKIVDEVSAGSDDAELDRILSEADPTAFEAAANYDVAALRAAVERDREILRELEMRANEVSAARDPKLAALADELARIVVEAERDGLDDEQRRTDRKVIVFSAYEDSIDWIRAFLDAAVAIDGRLGAYSGRIASAAGQDSKHGVSRQAAVEGFAPRSAGRADCADDPTGDRFDLLLATDVLAEGVNLQQCRNIVNYDLPWNPMRLVQRHGRVDRINSPHQRVFLRTFFPDRELDRLLNLEQRVLRKLAQAAASVGVETAPIVGGAQSDRSFAETRAEIDRLRKGDARLFDQGGTEGAAQTGEEYRHRLRKALEMQRTQIEELPWKAGSGIARGERRGWVFCARAGDSGVGGVNRVYLRFVPEDGGEVVREIGSCLRMVECEPTTPCVIPPELRAGVFDGWERARGDIWNAWMHETDTRNLQPKVPEVNRRIAAFLRKHPPSNCDHAAVQRLLDCVESPCSNREQQALREVIAAEHASPTGKANAIAECVKALGLEPFVPPAPLPPIGEEEVQLVVWMAVAPE